MPRLTDHRRAGRRSGVATSALRYYERLGLIRAARTGGNQRRYERAELRRVAFIRIAQRVGLSLDEIARRAGDAARRAAPPPRPTGHGCPRLAAPAGRADRAAGAAAGPADRLHRLWLPVAAALRALQPGRRAGRRRAAAAVSQLILQRRPPPVRVASSSTLPMWSVARRPAVGRGRLGIGMRVGTIGRIAPASMSGQTCSRTPRTIAAFSAGGPGTERGRDARPAWPSARRG